jgi:hypothetical protein
VTRREAMQLEKAALEALKVAAVNMVASKSGGYSSTRVGRDDTPLLARARFISAGERWVAASHDVVDAILNETKEERREYEGEPPVMGRSTPR